MYLQTFTVYGGVTFNIFEYACFRNVPSSEAHLFLYENINEDTQESRSTTFPKYQKKDIFGTKIDKTNGSYESTDAQIDLQQRNCLGMVSRQTTWGVKPVLLARNLALIS